mmetsp:Transcript_104060/g.335538  ORF Transcript_104060/g.335538 Transcript_104060/m.335538 type:complete len:439 (-) Transcript_104060:123-1439(-)
MLCSVGHEPCSEASPLHQGLRGSSCDCRASLACAGPREAAVCAEEVAGERGVGVLRHLLGRLPAVLQLELSHVPRLPQFVVHYDLHGLPLAGHRGEDHFASIHAEGVQDHHIPVVLDGLETIEPAPGDPVAEQVIGELREARPKLCTETVHCHGSSVRCPSELCERGKRFDETEARGLLPEGAVGPLVAWGELLHELLERLRLVNPALDTRVPREVNTLGRVNHNELKHDAQQTRANVLARAGVVAHDGGVHIHEDYQLLVGGRIPPDNVREVVLAGDGVQDVGLHEDAAVERAVVDDGVAVVVVAAEAVPALAEVDELPGARVPEVADARAVLGARELEVVVEEEDPGRLLAGRLRTSLLRRDHLGVAVRAPVLLPDREAGSGDVEWCRSRLADPVVELDVLPAEGPLEEVQVYDVHCGVGLLRLHIRLFCMKGHHR